MGNSYLTYLNQEIEKTTEELKTLEGKFPKEVVKNDEEYEIIYKYSCAKQKLELLGKIQRLPEYMAICNNPTGEHIDDELLELDLLVGKYSGDSYALEDMLFKPYIDDPAEVVKISKLLAGYVKQKRAILRDASKPREIKLEELKNLDLNTHQKMNNPIFETLPGLLDIVDIDEYPIYNINRMAASKTRREFGDIKQKIQNGQINGPSGITM